MNRKLNLIKEISLLAILMLVSLHGLAQDIKGVVKDKKTNEAIVGVGVHVQGTSIGTTTNVDGSFELKVPANSMLSFTFIGYQTLEFKSDEVPSVVLMGEDALLLDDAIIVGYATGSKRTISGAVQTIGTKDMNAGIITNPLEAMKGKVAGVFIQQSGGDPTVAPTIRIRGTTSLSGGNDPLVIIDGVFGDMNLMKALSPADIESFTILKDASETAQYGSRGASGVIVVTTKKGKVGAKTLNYDGTFGIETVYKNIRMLNASEYRSALMQFGTEEQQKANDFGSSTNFMEEMQRLGYTQTHRVSLGGGSEGSNYRASLGVIDQQGIIRTSSMRNFTAKLDATQGYFDNKLRMDMGMFGSKIMNGNINDPGMTFYSAAAFNPTITAAQNPDGTWIENETASQVRNPLGRLTIKDKNEVSTLTTHGRLTFDITNDLKFGAFGSYTYTSKEIFLYIPTTIKDGRNDRGKAERKLERTDVLMGNLSLNYKKIIDRHRIDALLLMEGQDYRYKGFNATARGFDTDFFETNKLTAGAVVKYGDVGSYNNGYNIFSFLGRINYVYDGKYIATVNMRRDGSSKLGENNKWGFFPSASLAWSIKDEGFMQDIIEVSALKVRAGYGVTGNQDAIGAFYSLAVMEPTGVTTVNGVPTVTFGYKRNPNPYLRWETKRMFDIGLDGSFFDNMVTLTMDYYYSKTKDLLHEYEVPVPPFQHNKLLANMGELENKGFELSVGVTPIRTNDMQLTVSGNVTFQSTKLLSLSGTYNDTELSAGKYTSISSVSGSGMTANNNVAYMMPGQPLGVFFIPKSRGLVRDPFDGSYRYDIVNDPNVEAADGENDRFILGQAMPKVVVGANIGFQYKQFDVQAQFNGAFGHKIYNGTSLVYMNMSTFPSYNVLQDAPNQNIRDNTITDYWLEKGDYLNITYISAGYNIDVSKMASVVKSMRVSFSVNNVHTFTNYSGMTPMINSSMKGDINSMELGVDNKNIYPLSRIYSLGLSVIF